MLMTFPFDCTTDEYNYFTLTSMYINAQNWWMVPFEEKSRGAGALFSRFLDLDGSSDNS